LSLEKRKNKVYSAEMKVEAVRLHLEEGLNPYRIAEMFENRSKTQVQQMSTRFVPSSSR
jgi:transposase-like protein